MKKIISVTLFVLIILACLSVISFAEAKELELPKANAVPTIDGKVSDGEWDGALTVEMKKGDTGLFVATGTTDTFNGAEFKYLWSEEGIYFTASVTDTTTAKQPPEGGKGSYNSGDGVQFNIYTDANGQGQDAGKLLFFSFNPKTSDGKAYVGEHFVYGTSNTGADVEAAKIAVEFANDGYVIEGLIPSEAFEKISPSVKLSTGACFYMNSVVMEQDEDGNQSLIVDNEWFDAEKANKFTLADAPETEPVTQKADASEVVKADNEDNSTENNEEATDSAQNNYIWVYVVIVAVVLVVVIAVIIVASKKKKDK